MNSSTTNSFVSTLEQLFVKAPALPTNVKEVIIKIAPYLALLFGVLGVLGAIGGLGLFAIFSPLAVFGGASGVASFGTGFLAALFWLASSAFMLVAFAGLKSQKISGWHMMFWSETISIVGSIISLAIVSAVVSALIGYYLLFQVKSYYK